MATPSSIEKFVTLRAELLKEKAALESRLARITAALSDQSIKAPARTVLPARRLGRRRARNKMSLKEAVLQVTRAKPLARQEIIDAVRKIGYKFTTKDPLNSLNMVIYSSKALKNLGGRFAPVK